MREPNALISTDALARQLGDSNLRVFDCTTYLEPTPPGSDDPYLAVPGRSSFETAHIPGADFLDLQGEFSDNTTRLRFMMPPVAELEAAFGRHGVGPDAHVVLYSIGTMMWATRLWWMLKALGFDGAAVLDGGFDKWQSEARPVESGPAKGYPPAVFIAKPRPGRFVDKQKVLAAAHDRRFRHRQCARPAVSPGFGAEPLWPARAHPWECQCAGGEPGRSAKQDLHRT